MDKDVEARTALDISRFEEGEYGIALIMDEEGKGNDETL
jgi:hypothetical protein